MDNVIDMTTRMELLRKQACFAKLHDEEIEILASLLTEQFLKKGTTIVTEGDTVDSVYIIVDGTARVTRQQYEDDKVSTTELATLVPPQAIGLSETGFYSLSGRRSATVVCESDMTLLRLSMAAFHGFSLAYSHVNQVMRADAKKMLGLS
jgi:CRP-like cAMP-binding protein